MRPVIRPLLAVFLAVLPSCTPSFDPTSETVGGVDNRGPAPGYTLFAPLRSTTTYLVNIDGKTVHSWESEHRPGSAVYLLENGDLLRGAREPDNQHFRGGGIGGRIQRFDWEGNLVWDFQYANEEHCLHHDVEPLPNGNILMIAWEKKTKDEAIAAGRNPELLSEEELWPDHVIEVKPEGKTGGKIVWEWHLWDHLIQDHDSTKENFGVVKDHPELVDINYVGSTPSASPAELKRLRALGYAGGGKPPEEPKPDPERRRRRGRPDWIHTNAIDYNPELDQIALSALRFNEIWVVDHSTSTAEAAQHTGGRSGKGGDLLYRWGNPASHGAGTAEDQQLFAQHDVRWIEPRHKGAGHFLVFNNGRGRPEGDFSSVDEIVPPVGKSGSYELLASGVFGPAKPAWRYTSEPKADFFSGHISGAHRLANGNTLICSGEAGLVFEVDTTGKKVWEYANRFGKVEERESDPPRDQAATPKPDDSKPDEVKSDDPKPDQPTETKPDQLSDGAAKEKDKDSGADGVSPPPDRPDRPDRRRRRNQERTALFRATRIPPDCPGLAGKTLLPLDPQPQPSVPPSEPAPQD